MNFDPNIGQYLIKAFAEGCASHAYIVAGEAKRLPRLLAECAVVTMCPNHTDDDCVCCRKVQSGKHQDVITLPVDPDKTRLAVTDIAYLVDESAKRPVDNSEARVFLLNAADSVAGVGSELWQNKLLKTLEEPLTGIYIFIGVTDAEGLLPTVRSRCQILRQHRQTERQVRDLLVARGYDAKYSEMAAAMAGGSAETAEQLFADDVVFDCYALAADIATQMTSTKNALRFASDILSKRDHIGDVLGFLTVLMRESIVYRLAPQLCLLPSMADTVRAICELYTLNAAEGCVELLNQAKKRLDNGGNVTVVVDHLLSNILEMRYRCRKS